MRIVYGVSGEGLGHVFEALEIAALLRSDGHEVKMLTFGDRACSALAAYQPTRIAGLPLYFGPGGLSLTKTLIKNRSLPWFYLTHCRRLKAEVAAFEPDVFLTAYEPFTTYLAHALKRPLISMDNQNELLHLPAPASGDLMSYRLVRWATRLCTHGAEHYIIKSFDKSALASSRRFRFVSPLVQADLRALATTRGNHALVYLTKPNAALVEVLRAVKQTFLIYGDHPIGVEGNLHFLHRGPSYLAALGNCKAIIGTTGFSLIADAIYLKKPYFGVPLKKQFEQTHNAHYLRKAGIGDFSEHPTAHDLDRFFSRLDGYHHALGQLDFDPTEQAEVLRELLDQIAGGAERPSASVTAAFH